MEFVLDTDADRDAQLEVLSDQTRRTLLMELLDEPPPENPTIDVAETVASTDSPATMVEMHHVHLPKLEDRGYVRWDRNAQLVTQGPQFGEIEPLLSSLRDHADDLPGELV